MTQILKLPTEVQQLILSNCEPTDVLAYAASARGAMATASDETFLNAYSRGVPVAQKFMARLRPMASTLPGEVLHMSRVLKATHLANDLMPLQTVTLPPSRDPAAEAFLYNVPMRHILGGSLTPGEGPQYSRISMAHTYAIAPNVTLFRVATFAVVYGAHFGCFGICADNSVLAYEVPLSNVFAAQWHAYSADAAQALSLLGGRTHFFLNDAGEVEVFGPKGSV